MASDRLNAEPDFASLAERAAVEYVAAASAHDMLREYLSGLFNPVIPAAPERGGQYN
jgi:hypothetical protein